MSSAASRMARLTGLGVRDARVAGSQHGYQHLMLTLAGGQRAFAKARLTPPDQAAGAGDPAAGPPGAPDQVAAAFAAEANGLRWLAEAQAVPVPRVLAVTEAALVVSMIQPGRATPEAAFDFGADLARLHGPARMASVRPGQVSSPACRWITP